MSDLIDPSKKPQIRKLGRGLGSLLSVPVEIVVPRGTTPPSPPTVAPRETLSAPERGPGLEQIPVVKIHPNPRQPRQDFSEGSIAVLAESIRSAGLMQPIVLRPRQDGEFELIAGERRWRAARLLGLERMPAIVRDADDQAAAEWALIENVQREDLNPIERSTALRRLADDFSLTHAVLAARVGLDRTSVTNLLRLAELDPFTSDAVRKGKISQGHAKALLALGSVEQRQTMTAAAISADWSVRETERRVQHALQKSSLSPVTTAADSTARTSAHLTDLERRLGEHLGTRVSLQLGRKRGTGRVMIDFYTLDQFDGLLAKLGFENQA